MMSFCARLEASARRSGSLLCIGLDPHPADLAAPTVDAARSFCLRIIEATAEYAAAYKPNAAFFEAYGPEGWALLAEVIAAVPDGIPVILDAKRGDISSTAEAYARSTYKLLGADAMTLSPYLGQDSLEAHLSNPEHGAFVLCKTSNPGSSDLQDLRLGGKDAGVPLYEKVARLARAWNTRDNLGVVVGATHPGALARVRELAPELWILAPGVGPQGGDLKTALRAGLRPDGLGLLVAVSRAIARATDPRQAAREMVETMRCAQESVVARQASSSDQRDDPAPLTGVLADLAKGLLAAGCVRFGAFTLKSGLQSPIYLDLRQLVSHPALLATVAQAYIGVLGGLQFDRLAALPYAALPIGTAISLQSGWPLLYPRKEAKAYGTAVEIEGAYAQGERVVVIDDLATTGGSKFEAIEKLTGAGMEAADVVVLIDRQSGARESLAQAGYRLHSVATLTQLLDYWEADGSVPSHQIAAARAFLAGA